MPQRRPASRLWVLAATLLSVACNDAIHRESRLAEYCSPGQGCMNSLFLRNLDKACAGKAPCRVTLPAIVGRYDRAFFVATYAAAFNRCDPSRVQRPLREGFSPYCQYLLLEEHGVISTFLRGSCDSDGVRLTGDGFDVENEPTGHVVELKPTASLRIQARRSSAQTRWEVTLPEKGVILYPEGRGGCTLPP